MNSDLTFSIHSIDKTQRPELNSLAHSNKDSRVATEMPILVELSNLFFNIVAVRWAIVCLPDRVKLVKS